jgi:hypothetical protein
MMTNHAPTRQRIWIEYFDQNNAFAAQLPREGRVEQELRFVDSAVPWYLLRLDEGVRWEGRSYSRLLLASRWAGMSIREREPTSVFLLLVPEEARPQCGQSITQYVHVAWGLARAL